MATPKEQGSSGIAVDTITQYVMEHDLTVYLDNLGESFTTRLLRLIDERGLKDSTVGQAVQHPSRQHFSKIQCNREYNPKRKPCWPLRWACTCLKMRPSTCSRARAMPFRMAPSGTGSVLSGTQNL